MYFSFMIKVDVKRSGVVRVKIKGVAIFLPDFRLSFLF